ncbi:hypothetical protein [Micromonospora sp. LOL_024]|uniref:hypothetical protein n=1 Tax=Micromonospora sp. LOL_024 TaxID=3345412 RepID=UPI003A8B5FAF
MGTEAEPTRSKIRTWVTPSRVGWLGTAAVVLLLALPIYVRGPGDHEMAICGNALATDLDFWAGPSDGNYWEIAYRSCNSKRIDRIGKAVGVLSITVLTVTLLAARGRRDGTADDSRT